MDPDGMSHERALAGFDQHIDEPEIAEEENAFLRPVLSAKAAEKRPFSQSVERMWRRVDWPVRPRRQATSGRTSEVASVPSASRKGR
jgi:hypothetical protein